jgi:predicted lipoprotein with Yx(FWY)xxD motif
MTSISPQHQLMMIQQALEQGKSIAFDQQNNKFIVLTQEVQKNIPKDQLITDLALLKDKVVELVAKQEITNTQRLALAAACNRAAVRLNKGPPDKQRFIQQLKELSTSIQKVNEQAAQIQRSADKTARLHQEQVVEALTATYEITSEQSPAIQQIVECFTTEKKFYQQIAHLNTLFQNPNFIAILKNKKIGDRALTPTEIAVLSNYSSARRAVENYLIGLHGIMQLIAAKKEAQALHAYAQLVQSQYSSYADSLTDSVKGYTVFTRYANKLKAAETEFRKKCPQEAAPIFADRQSIQDKQINLVQRAPRHDLFAQAITKKNADDELIQALQTIKRANLKIDAAQGQFDDLTHKDGIKKKLVDNEDTKWTDALQQEGLDRVSLMTLNSWYDALGQAIVELELPIKALKQDPNNLALKKEVRENLQKLQKEFTAHGMDIQKFAQQKDSSLVDLDRAIALYRQKGGQIAIDYGQAMHERLQTVASWLQAV